MKTLCLPLLAVLHLTSSAAQPALAPAPTPVTVTTGAVRTVDWPEHIQAQGSVAAWQEAVVASPTSGVAVVELAAAVGDRVRRGALLARLDDRALAADLERARAEHERAGAVARQAETEAVRARTLKAGGSASEQEWQAAETARELALAQLKAAQAAERAAEIRLADTRLLAPDDGMVTARQATLGQVPPAGTELFRLMRQSRLEWRAEVGAQVLARLKVGDAAMVQLPDGGQARGRLRQLGGTLDPSTRLATVYVDLLPGSAARAGMHAAGRFELASRTGLAVPASAVQVRDGKAVVFVVDDGKSRQITVMTGRRTGDEVEVLGPLRSGQRVVVLGAGHVRDGLPVRQTWASPPPLPPGKARP